MRILYVSDVQSMHTRRWAESFRDRGNEVHIASFRPGQIPGVQVHVLPSFGLGKAGYLLATPVLKRLAARLKPEVVHAQYVTSYGFVAAAAGLKPLVLTAWGSDVLVSPQQSSIARWLTRYALSRAQQITTVAEHMNASVIALGAPASKVIAAPFGVDTSLFMLPDTPRAPSPPLRIISTRNFAPMYSVHSVVEAARLVHSHGVCLMLDLVGAGPLRAALETQVHEAGLVDQVRFHGHVDHPRLVKLLGAAHVFITSALSDGNNVSLNEAMACGCFPIATNIPANQQWIEDGKNGLLYKAADAQALAVCIQRAASDASLRETAVHMNRNIVEQRANWDASVQRMHNIYDRLARHHTNGITR
jgi:L-malate glycosyltransferase